jgi:type I restriction enzyme S subunit
MWSLRPEHFKLIYTVLPPPDEQAAIVRFLDHANRKIDGFIRAKRKLIGLLNEQKQAIIHRAVTRGLNPDVPLKPSGIPWLGDIPAHWEVMQMRHVLSFGPKNGVSPQASNGVGVLSFSISAVRDGRISIPGNEKIIELDHARVAGFRIHKGDILLVRGNGNVALVGKCGLVDDYPENCVYPDILMKIRPNDKMISEFVVLAVNSSYVSNQVSTLAKTSNGAFKVSGATVRSIVIAVPSRSEQEAILEQLLHVLANAECVKERTLSEIALMQEYRTRLTADIVTGKLDVREAAARLPELPPDAPPETADDNAPDDLENEESHE